MNIIWLDGAKIKSVSTTIKLIEKITRIIKQVFSTQNTILKTIKVTDNK